MKEPERIDLSKAEADALLERVANKQLKPEDYEMIGAMLKSWVWFSGVVQTAKVSIKELKKMIFGAKTEKTRKVLKKKDPGKKTSEAKKKSKGHGRKRAEDYPGAKRVCLKCEDVKEGDRCTKCGKGKLYRIKSSKIVCVHGAAPIDAIVYEQEKFRCNLCGGLFKADLPPEATGPKYDASANSMMALMHYGCGFPFNRFEDLQANLGVPLPSSTQWDLLKDSGNDIEPVFNELKLYASAADIFHNDDTSARILGLEKEIAKELETSQSEGKKCRTGVFTTGIVAERDGRNLALFFTGRKHAGENLGHLLKERPEHLGSPIQMCDALSRNAPKGFNRFLANCLSHGRREFVKIFEDFPDECTYVLETLRRIYINDDVCRKKGMPKEERLEFHQKNSKSIMDEFFEWMNSQLDDKKIEPNSSIGRAIKYMIKHWEELTLFLRVPGAPLDNNICERALKAPIRYRNNSFFFKTQQGAFVADMFMSMIHTCRLNGINAFEYLTAILNNAQPASTSPQEWLPWNFHEALDRCTG